MLPPPLNKFLLFAAFFIKLEKIWWGKKASETSSKWTKKAWNKTNKEKRPGRASSRKKEKIANRRKTLFCQKNREKFHELWRQTEGEKERLLHLQMKNKTKSINSSDSAVAVTNSFLEIPRELIHVNMDSDSKNLITLGEGTFGKVTLILPFIEKCLLQWNNSIKESRKQKLSTRQTLFPHLIRPNLSCLYYNSNSFFGRNDSTDFYDFFDSFCKNSVLNITRYISKSFKHTRQ